MLDRIDRRKIFFWNVCEVMTIGFLNLSEWLLTDVHKSKENLHTAKYSQILNYAKVLRQVRHVLNMIAGGIVNKITLLSIPKPYFWWRKSHSSIKMGESNGTFFSLYIFVLLS